MNRPNFEDFPNNKLPLVWVVWVDSLFGPNIWKAEEDEKRFLKSNSNIPHDTVGHLLYMDEDKMTVALALSHRRDGGVAGTISIPLSSVHEIRVLKYDGETIWPKKDKKRR